MQKTDFIIQMESNRWFALRDELFVKLRNYEEVVIAMDGRLCDLEDTLDINKYL